MTDKVCTATIARRDPPVTLPPAWDVSETVTERYPDGEYAMSGSVAVCRALVRRRYCPEASPVRGIGQADALALQRNATQELETERHGSVNRGLIAVKPVVETGSLF
jgi:hypothetical protein